MLIVCKTCSSSYHIPREVLGENGCQLRCVGCGDMWAVSPEAGAPAAPPIVESRPLRPSALGAARPWPGGGGEFRSDDDAPKPGFLSALVHKSAGSAGQRRTIALIAIVALAMAVVAWRKPIVKAVPGAARVFAAIGLPVNLRGLALANVRTNIFDLGDRKMLVVEGALVNLRDSPVDAPNMRIALRGADKRELYVWTAPAPKGKLAPNEQVAFRTRLAAPPDGVDDVMVKFASVGDKLSPMKDGL
jgi:predicted Zn finger-like uncharacterized protein